MIKNKKTKHFLRFGYPFIFVISVLLFFAPFILHGKLPIPADTIIGLYNPFRDLYAKDYPNGIPYKNFLITDPVRQQYPWRLLAIEQEKKGQLPLWNPYTFAGTPLLGSVQSAAFYPLNILFLVLPFAMSWSMLILLQPLLAGLFFYWYVRNLKIHRIASLLGSVVFAFSGSMIAWLEWGTLGHVMAWLPLILLSIDKLELRITNYELRKKNTLMWSLLYLFSLISSFFAGHLQIFFYVFIFSLLYFFACWWQLGKSLWNLSLFLILNSLFLILTFIQWFPTLQFILNSARSIDQMHWQQIEGWFIPWQHLIQFVAPDFFGNPTTLNYWGTWNYGELVGYVGIFPLLLALFALFFRYDKKTLFVGTAFFLSLVFALPTVFAKLPFLLDIPFLSTSQPTRLLAITDFCLALLAAFGLDYYLRLPKEKKIIYPLIFLGIIFSTLWLFVLVGSQTLFALGTEDILTAKRNLLFPTMLFGIVTVILILLLFFKNAKIRTTLVLLLVVITIVDLLRFAQKFTPFSDEKYLFPQTKILSYLQEQHGQFRIMTTDDRILPPNFSSVYKLQSLDGYDPLYLRRYGELMAAIGRNKPDMSAPFGFNRIIAPHTTDSRLIDLLGVRYILSLSDLSEKKFTKVMREGETRLYENPRAFPRAFLVTNVTPAKSKEEAIKALFDTSLDLKKTAIVEDWDKQDETFSRGKISIVSYGENTITVHTDTEGQSFLVLMDSFYPTWHAKVCSEDQTECKETTIYRTNYHFRGIIVPQGRKSVIFYQSLL